MGRQDGHHYDAPESDEDRAGKSWSYLALGILVVVLPVLIASRDGADLPDLTAVRAARFGRMQIDDVRRLPLGTFVRPPEETGGPPRVEAVYGYAVPHGDGLVLLDTGIGATDEETEAWYRPRRVPLYAALAEHGWSPDDVRLVVNCHLHFDHCGENPLFAGRRIVAQRRELATARAGDYTFEALVDFEGVSYEELDGEAELLPGVHCIPTPGHVDGHQSLVVECDDGSIVLAGQSHDAASLWSGDALAAHARELGHDDPLPTYPAWIPRLLAFDPRRVVFAHDAAVWTPG